MTSEREMTFAERGVVDRVEVVQADVRDLPWDGLLRGAGLDRVSAEQHPFRASDEVRTMIRWIGVREYVAVLVRLARLYRDEQDLRDLLRGGMSTPRHVTRHIGAGIYVGEVPVAA